RFSEGVAEDGQLIARDRGAHSIIATFEDEPYRAPFSGNVIELCPVGALTSTQYRFEARPWEIQNVPSVCGLCPVGCNITATTREGKVKRILSRNHPEIDEGWLCDKGRFSFMSLYASDRVRDPLRRIGKRRFEEVSWDGALDEAERLLRHGPVLLALSGSETVEQAAALSRFVRQGLGSDAVVLPEQVSTALDAFRAPLSAIGEADLVVVAGDDPVEERAPVVGLWIKAARRRGAEIVTVGVAGSVLCAPGTAAETVRSDLAKKVEDAENTVLIWSGPGGAGGDVVAALAGDLGAAAAFYLPATPNGRAVSEAWHAAGEGEPTRPEKIGLLLVSGDDAANDPQVQALAEEADAVIAIAQFHDALRGIADLVLPATSYLERDGTMVNLEGRPQRLRRAVIPPTPDELAWIAKLAERFGVEVDPHARAVPADERATLPPRTEPGPAPTVPGTVKTPTAKGGPLRLLRYRPLFSGPEVERVDELQFQRPRPEIELSAHDAEIRHISTGDEVVVRSNGTTIALRALVNRKLRDGVVRAAEEHVRELAGAVEVSSSRFSPEGGEPA
ncbi:MAG TPA: molybdopterin-dependent oxidoreductase, partial [Gaiellaceae bacterium]|nr:molybdopterin-dependent oxidoreductase [Gaiellaceae bacterium]